MATLVSDYWFLRALRVRSWLGVERLLLMLDWEMWCVDVWGEEVVVFWLRANTPR